MKSKFTFRVCVCTHTWQKYVFLAPPSLGQRHHSWYPQQSKVSWPCWCKIPLQQSPAKANKEQTPCSWVPPSSQHTATAAHRKHFSLLGRKNSHLIRGLAFSSFGKQSKILQKEDGSWGVVSWRKSLAVFGWFVSYMILSVLPGPSHATSFLLWVFTVIPLAMAELFLGTPTALWLPLLHPSSSLKTK